MLGFSTIAKQLFGSANERKIRPMNAAVAKINAFEPKFIAMSDEELLKLAEGDPNVLEGEVTVIEEIKQNDSTEA